VSNIEKNDINRPEIARRIDKKSKFCFKLPRIDMEMSGLGKNCKKSSKICLLNGAKMFKRGKNLKT